MKRSDKNKYRTWTVLGKETVFDGVLKFSENLKIEGSFTGAIDAKGALVIAESANCKVQYIKAASIIVEGTVLGSLSALKEMELRAGCFVKGDVSASRLKIADNVSFEGAIKMVNDVSSVAVNMFSAETAQLKDEIAYK